jgi:serine protease Do
MRRFLSALAPTVLALALAHGAAAQEDLKELAREARKSVVHLKMIGAGGQPVGTGSGFFVGPQMLATNHHVIAGAVRVEALLEGGIALDVLGVLADDEEHDLALLEVGAGPHPALPLASFSGLVEPGEKIIVLGSPLGLSGTLSEGIVSAVRSEGLPEEFRQDGKTAPLLQITAAISPGSSGSPVMNLRGEVVGVAVSQMVAGQNLNFAVPVPQLRELMNRAANGGLERSFRGPPGKLSDLPWHNLVISVFFFGALFWAFRRLW